MVSHESPPPSLADEQPATAISFAAPSDGAMRELYRFAKRVAAGTINVLILGETGVGKDVLAESIHRLSPRAAWPFVRINCAALAQHLVESELFGYEQGSFTGATRTKPGLLETAQKGTVFLDEVGEIPLAIQAKLLRVVETREVVRVGGIRPRHVDVRFVSATNRDLEADVRRGVFRQDLYYRLNGIVLTVPPLRDRPSDIDRLVDFFLTRSARELGSPKPVLAEETAALLRAYSWPGNVRELRNIIERALLLCDEPIIRPEHLSFHTVARPSVPVGIVPANGECELEVPGPCPTAVAAGSVTAGVSTAGPKGGSGEGPSPRSATRHAKTEAEKHRIIQALALHHGNQTRAAQFLGMPRRTLVAKLPAYGIPRPRKSPPTPTPGKDADQECEGVVGYADEPQVPTRVNGTADTGLHGREQR